MATSGSQTSVFRVQKDLKEIHSMPFIDDPPIYVHAVDGRVEDITAMVVAPSNCPYESGFYVFSVRIPTTYPNEPPKVRMMTTDNGRVRMNPNLYADGKVCLSILGTWRGETTETWRSSYSISYVLQAIQCMILNDEPFYNEPGFEKGSFESGHGEPVSPPAAPATEDEAKELATKRRKITAEQASIESKQYGAKITHESLRVAVCDTLEATLGMASTQTQSPTQPSAAAQNRLSQILAPFSELIKRYFLTRYETYLAVCDRLAEYEGKPFNRAPFEFPGNICDGVFAPAALKTRLVAIHDSMNAESARWCEKGAVLTHRLAYSACVLRDEYERLKAEAEGFCGGPVDSANVFLWRVTFMPQEGLYEESMYTIEVIFSEDASAPPRVKFLQPIYHPNITASGTPLHFLEDHKVPLEQRFAPQHVIQSTKALLTKQPYSSPATWVNEEAGRLCFSKDPDQQRLFRKKARQLARATVEGTS